MISKDGNAVNKLQGMSGGVIKLPSNKGYVIFSMKDFLCVEDSDTGAIVTIQRQEHTRQLSTTISAEEIYEVL